MALSQMIEHLRTLPDDWGSWLVYADALTEAGDSRGQLLVLEHQLAAEPALVQRADAIADDWLAAHVGRLGADDADVLAWLRTLRPLARRGAPAFAIPQSQLLALLDLDTGAELSPALADQRDRVIAATLAWIDRAFDGVPVPDEDHYTIHQAEAADNYQGCDRSRDHLGRWQELPDDHLLDNQWALAHLDEQGIHYYVPAVMTFALRHRTKHERDGWLTESLEYTLQPSGANLRAYQQERFALLDREQRAAICAYALVERCAEAAAAWLRVLEAERDGPRNDWFEIYSPA